MFLTLAVIRLGTRESLHASLKSSCWITTLVPQQFAGTLTQSIPCFVFIILTFLHIYQTAQTCVLESSLQGKEKKTLLGNGAQSHVRCLLPCMIWARSCQLIQLKQSSQIGSPSSESLDCVVLNMRKKLSQHSMSIYTLQAKEGIKAFIPTDWRFYDSSGSLINFHTLNSNL